MSAETPPRPPKPLYSNISTAVPSPCVSLCKLDDERVCVGCFRHVEDIRAWRAADDAHRRVICEQARERRLASEGAQRAVE